MAINKKTTCNACGAEFEIVESDDYPIFFCASCGAELEEDEEADHNDEEV